MEANNVIKIDFKKEDFVNKLLKKMQREKTTIEEDFFETFSSFLTNEFIEANINFEKISAHYLYEYYDKHKSLKEYLNNEQLDFYYVQLDFYSKKEDCFDIYELKLPEFLELTFFHYYDKSMKIKVKNHNLKTKNRITVELLQLVVKKTFLKEIMEKIYFNSNSLLPSKLVTGEWRQTFYNKISGESYFCSCFKKAIHKDEELYLNIESHVQYALNNNNYKENICHICKDESSNLFFCNSMYGSSVMVRYGAYIHKLSLEMDISEREAENIIREKKGIAKIGERWINETILFNYIKEIFSNYEVIREASPKWLEKQRLDIFIPSLKLAIEYQGEQHYNSVPMWGGEEGLRKNKERDKEKLEKCKKNKIDLIYFTYKDNLNEKLVMKKLKKYLQFEKIK